MPKKAKSGKPIRKAQKAKKTHRRGTKTPSARKNPVKRKESPRKQASSAKVLPKIDDWVRPQTSAKYWAERIGQIISITGKGAETTALIRFQYSYVTGKKVQIEQWAFPLSRCIFVPDFYGIVSSANPKDPKGRNPNLYSVEDDEIKFEAVD